MATFYLCLSLPLLLLTLTALIPSAQLFIDLPSHFTLQYFIASAALLALAPFFKPPLWSLALPAIALAPTAIQLAPYIPRSFLQETAAPSLRILQTNVLRTNLKTAPLRQLIISENPDVIVASETTELFAAMFQTLEKEYPYQKIITQERSSYGMAVLSKFPLNDIEEKYFAHKNIPALFFRIIINGQAVDILSLHTANPLVNIKRRDQELLAAAAMMTGLPTDHKMITGDFNATPFCSVFKELQKSLPWQNARHGRGYFGSYPSAAPLPFLRIPIDHTLHSPGLSVVDFRLGPDIGSDHLPVISHFSLNKSSNIK